mmetsp:Transcript_11720/g.19905  ORF Transcript_11720/g.19905 Transcript_11720/m.19905 type:complete len:196 (-) Transcript_11720:74-661(-)
MSSKKNKNKAKKQAVAAVQETQSQIAPGEEMFYMAPDPNTKYTRPSSMAGKIDDSKFVVVWPANINSYKTEKEGRRVCKESCCEDPIVSEMSEVCTFFKLVHVIEPFKMYPRESGVERPMPGRVRIMLNNEDGSPANAEVPTRLALMRKMGELIPTMTIRQKRIEMENTKMAALAQHHAVTVGGGGAKKKGGGKR